MHKNIIFGQYRQKNSAVHSIDPRVKLACLVILSIFIFIMDSAYQFIVMTSFIVLISAVSGMSIRNFFSNMRNFYFIFGFIIIMYLIFSPYEIAKGIFSVWRFFLLVSMSFIFSFTTEISDIVASMQFFSMPLKAFGVKPRNIAVMVSIAIRFVPAMFVSFEKLREAMLARLADFRNPSHIRLVVVVLMEKMMRTASNLADAMHSRLYN